MDPTRPPPPPPNEIITPIHPGYPQGRKPGVKRANSPLRKMMLLVLASAALTAAGVGWIHHLSQETVQTVAVPPPAQPPAEPAVQMRPPSPADTETPLPAPATPPPDAVPGPSVPAGNETAEDLGRLLASAGRNESAGDLSAALRDFQEALRIDAGSAEARNGLRRIKSRMAEEEYRKRMAAGILALNAGNYENAQSALLKAKALKPESREVQEALTEVETGLRLARIETLRQRAVSAEQGEDWRAALAAYEAALALDPNLQFALQGRERSAMRLKIDARIAYFLNQPDILGSDAQLDSARSLLQEVRSAEPLGSGLSAKVERLGTLVEIASTPLPVIIESDNLTEVAVYRIGRLGKFTTRELNLRPGTYTVTGSRDGYRDVRQEVVVRPAPEPIRIAIKCREKV